VDSWLFYADGGYSNTRIRATAFTTATGALFESASANANGWYLGAGLDYAVTQNIIVGLQYTRVNTDNVLLTFPVVRDNRSANDKIDLFEVHASFKLWPGLIGPMVSKY
jgi:outer membrane immunogenic protein